ncbi:Metallo-hydrolase/oxidoreductase [Lentithecium fluviatile CBS 122367]|uniref:Metallo-hydrolase/oxidoreductase n=1 Tax=Lentithecium fluviatile CBS 122367 TaxID=1168545 RepID=A0A6G1IXU2_9PLEO|nr:Metallo-hydrolase/oxidoreductase [Lentithecium fluviatile CBS 122367]
MANLHSALSPKTPTSGRKTNPIIQRPSYFPAKIARNKPQGQAKYTTASPGPGEPTITSVFEPVTGTFQYIVADPTIKTACIIDPVLDYDPVTQALTTASADRLLDLTKKNGYRVDWILETHAHADHLTAASYLRSQLEKQQGHQPSVGIGKRIGMVQERFGKRYGVPAKEYEGVFDKLFDDDEVFEIGEMKGVAMHLPGHTPDHLGYRIGDNVFCGDSVFHVDIGTARCDFPGGSIPALWQSAQRLLTLPDNVKIWTGHDYPPDERSEPVPWVSVKQHKELNKHIKKGIKEEEFVAMRTERDKALAAPRLLHQSLQFNIRGGKLPEENESGLRLMHLPLKVGEVW